MNSSPARHSRSFSLSAVAFVCCVLACILPSCSGKPNTAIYGQWQEAGDKDITEFREDGTFRIGGGGGGTMTGKFKFVGADRVKLELDGAEGKVVGPMVCKIVIEGDTLDMTMPDGSKSRNQTTQITGPRGLPQQIAERSFELTPDDGEFLSPIGGEGAGEPAPLNPIVRARLMAVTLRFAMARMEKQE